METSRWTKTDPIEDRCDFILNNGERCGNRRIEPCDRCPLHGANKKLEATERSSLRMYRLAKYQKRANEFSDHSQLKSLREEIAILRIILEEKMNQCDDTHSLLLQAGPIADLVMKLEKIVASCHRLESSLGGLLDKTRVKQIGNEMMNSVSVHINEHISDPDLVSKLLEAVATDVLASIERKD